MARLFDIRNVSGEISIGADRTAQAPYTVKNATAATIRGDAVVVVLEGAADPSWFRVDPPSHRFEPGKAEQITVIVTVPEDAPAGRYRFHLRMLLGGGVPEEEFDDGQSVEFEVESPPPPPPPPSPPQRRIPWWLIVLLVIIALVVIGVIAWLLWPRSPAPRVIDFETPPLGAADRQLRDPLTIDGVTFRSSGGAAVLGVVKNRVTSACVDPANDDHKLGTGTGGGNVGLAGFPMQAQFNPPLSPDGGPARVSVTFQGLQGSNFRLRLVTPTNLPAGEATGSPTVLLGTCGFPGGMRGEVTLTVETQQPVSLVVMEELSFGGRVFVVDDFTFSPAP